MSGKCSVAGVDDGESFKSGLAGSEVTDTLRVTVTPDEEDVETTELDLYDLGALDERSGNGMIGNCEGCSAMQAV